MQKFSIYLSCALAMGLGSCSSDNIPDNKIPQADEGNIYASLSLSFSGGTRGETRSQTENPGDNPAQSTDGFEIGKDRENNVQSVLVILASKADDGTYSYITDSGICKAYEATAGTGDAKNPVYRLKFNTTALTPHAGKNVHLFAYCNPRADLVEGIDKRWNIDLTRTIADEDKSEIWADNNFLMTNASVSVKTLPSETDMNTVYNKPQNPFDLGKVQVERVSARFDFAGMTVKGTDGKDLAPNTYPIYEYIGESDGTQSQNLQGYVEIDGLSLFNEAKTFYYIPRVAENTGTGPEAEPDMTKVEILGKETPDNWVISPALTAGPADYFYNLQSKPLPSSFTYTPVSTILGNDEDENKDWNSDNSKADYHIWRYTTENTLAGVNKTFQRHGSTTGVLFRAKISAVAGSDLDKAITAKEPVYAFNGIMYGSQAQLIDYISKNPRSDVSVALQNGAQVKIDLITNDTADKIKSYLSNNDNVKNFLSKSSDDFNRYAHDGNGNYYVYYYYFNRHNDNGNNTQMGPMEFATVRNNVYKLRIKNIYQWGNPGDKPTDPDNPDESPEVYFRLEVEVLPWVVRLNDIEF